LLSIVASPRSVRASCDQIPGAVESFRGAQGSVDRPFAGPNDFVTVSLAGNCAASPGFGEQAEDLVVTLVFRPPSGIDNVVVLATDCEALEDRRAACANLPSVASATCPRVTSSTSFNRARMDLSASVFRTPTVSCRPTATDAASPARCRSR
jgi:hypothetical protein